MISFTQVLTDVFNNVRIWYGNLIDLTEGSNSNINYSIQAQNAFTSIQAQNVQQNNLSIYAATGNNLNALGTAMGYRKRPYYPISLICAAQGTALSIVYAGLECTWTDSFGNIYYFETVSDFTLGAFGTIENIYLFYVGSQDNIPEIPAGDLKIVPGSLIISDGTLNSVINDFDVTPILYNDLDFRAILINIGQSSSFGIDGSIKTYVETFSYVASCQVYIGVNLSGTTPIVIHGDVTINLPFGQLFIVVDYVVPIINTDFIRFSYIETARNIFARWDTRNILYANIPPLDNQVTVDVKTITNNTTIPITFYAASEFDLTLSLFADRFLSATINDSQFLLLKQDLANYIENAGIGQTIYFSTISTIASGYGLILTSMTVNGTPLQFSVTLYQDQVFNLLNLNPISYV